MKKTVNINLGGLAFVIDENAFELLHNYIETLKTSFSNESERDEIIQDIEARIAEMLNQKLASRRQIVNTADIEEVIAIMGKPEDISGEQQVREEQKQTPEGAKPPQTPIHSVPGKKRLFRDPDDKRVGGVIAGLCHYFGIEDPTWMRLAVVLLMFLSFGTVLLVYFLLLIVIPEAGTAAEKLQMKGEPVNIKTIEKEIKDAALRAGESVKDLTGQQNIFEKIFHVALLLVTGFLKIIAGIFVFIGVLILFALMAALFGISVAGNVALTHAPYLFIDSPATLAYFKVGLVLFVAAPVLGLIYGALRLIFGKRTHVPWLKWALTAMWWAGVMLLGYSFYEVGAEFSVKAVKNESIALMQPQNGHIKVQLTDENGQKATAEDEDPDWQIDAGGVIIDGKDLEERTTIPIGEPSLQLMPSPNDSFYVYQLNDSRGCNKGDALTNTGYVVYRVTQTDTLLQLPANVALDKNGKFRIQQVKIRIAIPEGKKLSFDDNIDRWEATVKGDGFYDDTFFANTTWSVQNGKVVCVGGENHFKEDKADGVTSAEEQKAEAPEKKTEQKQQNTQKP